MTEVGWLAISIISAIVLWLTSKAIIMAYFTEKERFTDRLIEKQKGTSSGTSKGK